MSDPDNYNSMAFRNPDNWTTTTDNRQLTGYVYSSPYYNGVTKNVTPREYGALMGVRKGGSRRRTVHRKRKSHRKSKRVHHTRRKQSRRHRHSRRRHHR